MDEEVKAVNLKKLKNFCGKKCGIDSGIIVIFLAMALGFSIYNTPANRLTRQLNLGQKYLNEQNYEQAVV